MVAVGRQLVERGEIVVNELTLCPEFFKTVRNANWHMLRRFYFRNGLFYDLTDVKISWIVIDSFGSFEAFENLHQEKKGIDGFYYHKWSEDKLIWQRFTNCDNCESWQAVEDYPAGLLCCIDKMECSKRYKETTYHGN